MKKIVEIRGCKIGEGIPKICVPLLGGDVKTLCEEAEALVRAGADLAEWRIDWFEHWNESNLVVEALSELRRCLGEIPLLVTFRTKREGGKTAIEPTQYLRLYECVLQSGQADLIDLELFMEEEIVSDLIQKAENADVRTVLSNHDFSRTPEKGEILWRLRKMEQLGADIAKIAVMPRRPEDVAVLLGVTSEAVEMMSCPVITMSMGGQGVISRMAGQIFGSAVTFGTVGQASAPGQIPLDRLKEILTLIDSVQ